MKPVRVKCLGCDQVVNLDPERAMVLFHYANRFNFESCMSVYEYRTLTTRERAWDNFRRLIDWRVFFIMFLSGTPIMLFTDLAFGWKVNPPWIIYVAWVALLLIFSFIAKRLGI